MIARYVKRDSPLPGWHSQEQAWAQTQGQLAWYRAMEEAGEMVQIADAAGLERHLEHWDAANGMATWRTRRSGTSSASRAPTRS